MRRLLDVGRNLSLVAGALVVFALSASATMYLMMRQPVVRTPALVGTSLAEARRWAERAGLTLEVKSTLHDDRYPAGVIIEQWPPSGMAVKRGQPLRVSVSLGPRPSQPSEAPARSVSSAGEPAPAMEGGSEGSTAARPLLRDEERASPTSSASPSGSARERERSPEGASEPPPWRRPER
ncbi:hypothetical protein HRbin10_00376 [bacterium HR10]|nr:hypothetical protein HRbin10_00376 [bacterium HR10]